MQTTCWFKIKSDKDLQSRFNSRLEQNNEKQWVAEHILNAKGTEVSIVLWTSVWVLVLLSQISHSDLITMHRQALYYLNDRICLSERTTIKSILKGLANDKKKQNQTFKIFSYFFFFYKAKLK